MTTGQTGQLQYWKPGSEERQLRVFISHRYGDDRALYDGVIDALGGQGFSVQDMSLTEDKQKKGPRGGKLPELAIQAEIAARIFSSDIFVAPSRVAVAWSHWLTWEVQTATICYGLPALFVRVRDQQNQAQIVSDIAKLGLPARVCERDARQIVSNISELTFTRPTWAVRMQEQDANLRLRGPVPKTLDTLMRQYPYHARLPNYQPTAEVKKRRLFDGWFGRGR